MKEILKNIFTSEQNRIQRNMDKIYDMGVVQGRLDMLNDLIDLHDAGSEFLAALSEVQSRTNDLMEELRKKGL